MKMRIIIIASLVTLGLLAFPTDIAVVLWIQNSHPPKELLRFLNFAEVFGHGIGVAAIMIGTFCLDEFDSVPIHHMACNTLANFPANDGKAVRCSHAWWTYGWTTRSPSPETIN